MQTDSNTSERHRRLQIHERDIEDTILTSADFQGQFVLDEFQYIKSSDSVDEFVARFAAYGHQFLHIWPLADADGEYMHALLLQELCLFRCSVFVSGHAVSQNNGDLGHIRSRLSRELSPDMT